MDTVLAKFRQWPLSGAVGAVVAVAQLDYDGMAAAVMSGSYPVFGAIAVAERRCWLIIRFLFFDLVPHCFTMV